MMTTRIGSDGRIDIEMDPRCTDHFNEWATLFAAVRWIERGRLVTSVYIEIAYVETTGRSPWGVPNYIPD